VRTNRRFAGFKQMEDVERELQIAAERVCGAPATFEGMMTVRVIKGPTVAWQGAVYQFQSTHGRVYAWADRPGKNARFVAMLHTPAIDSPPSALCAWLGLR
jgi:hypothetical protein